MAESPKSSPADNPAATPHGLRGFIAKFTVLRGAPRELWLTFVLKFLNNVAYGVTNSTIVLWLSSDLGYSDTRALAIVGAWALTMTITVVLVGSFTDTVGLRRTFFIGTWILIVARAVMVLANLKWLALVCGLFPVAVGEALGTPVLIAAVRRYTTTRQRPISFSLLYVMMNAGFAAAAFPFDFVRKHLGEYGHLTLAGMNISTYQILFLVSLGVEFLILPLLYCLREGVDATDEGLKITPRVKKYPQAGVLAAMALTVRDAARETGRLFATLLSQKGFYRLLAFLAFIACIKFIYKQIDYVYPAFGVRVLGDGAPIGKLMALNFILIIFLAPSVGALTQRFSAYSMVIVGGTISAASVFFMALPTEWFKPMADGFFGDWLGHWYLGLQGPVHPYYVMVALFVTMLSVGEAFYSPRVYEYAAAIAPKGQEASYGALSYIPLLLAKMLTAAFGGILLARYCPAQGERHPAMLWLAVALTACIAPIGLTILRRYIRVHEAGRVE
jgi:MFS family permease